jgi:hypothetical protein
LAAPSGSFVGDRYRVPASAKATTSGGLARNGARTVADARLEIAVARQNGAGPTSSSVIFFERCIVGPDALAVPQLYPRH